MEEEDREWSRSLQELAAGKQKEGRKEEVKMFYYPVLTLPSRLGRAVSRQPVCRPPQPACTTPAGFGIMPSAPAGSAGASSLAWRD